MLLYHLPVKEITPLINNNTRIELWPHSREIPVSLQIHKQFRVPFFPLFLVSENKQNADHGHSRQVKAVLCLKGFSEALTSLEPQMSNGGGLRMETGKDTGLTSWVWTGWVIHPGVKYSRMK